MLDVNINKALPGFSLKVSFSINREILSIVGPSGSGKSLTLQCISGLMNPDQGYININDRTLYDSRCGFNLPPQKRKIGYVFQNYALFPHLTVFNNVAFGISGLDRAATRARVSYLLGKMRLNDFSDRFPRHLSGGQQQRVALARALAPEPEILLLDEPFSALDTQVRRQLEQEILTLHQFYQGNIIFVSHNLEEAYRLGSQIAVYKAGRILQLAPKDILINAPANKTVATLTGTKNLLEGVIERLEDSRADVFVNEWNKRLKISLSSPDRYHQNQKVIVGIRPEYIRIGENFGENKLKATVVEAVDGISSYTYRFRVENSPGNSSHLEAEVSKLAAPYLPAGEKCRLQLPVKRVFIIGEAAKQYPGGDSSSQNSLEQY